MDRSEPDKELTKEEQDSIETTEKKILLLKERTNLDLHEFLMTIRNKPMTAAFLRKKGNGDERISAYFRDLNRLRADILNIYLDKYERRFKFNGQNKTTLDFSRIMVPNEKYMRSEDGVPIYYQKWSKRSENTKGLFLCQHGNSVHGDLFAPFSDIARMNGWDVIAVDNTGHGRSGIKNGLIDNYKRMYFIYNKLISTWLKEHPGKPVFLIGESLGTSFIIGYIADLFRKTAYLKRRMKSINRHYQKDPKDPINSININYKMVQNGIKGIILLVPPYKLRADLINGLLGAYNLLKILHKFLYIPLEILAEIGKFRPLFRKRFWEPINSYLDSFLIYDEKDLLFNADHHITTWKNQIILLNILRKDFLLVNKPTFILEGSADSIVTPSGAIELYNLLKSNPYFRKQQRIKKNKFNKILKLKIYRGANHSLFMDKNSQDIYFDLINWAEYHNV